MQVFHCASRTGGVGSDSLFCEVGRDPRGAHRRFMVVRCLVFFVFFSVFGHFGEASKRTCLAPPGKATSRKSAQYPESPSEVSGNLFESQSTAGSVGATRPSRVGSTHITDELDVQLVPCHNASERDDLQELSLQVGRSNGQSKAFTFQESEKIQTARTYPSQREGEREVEARWQDGQGRSHCTIPIWERDSFRPCEGTTLDSIYSNQTAEPSDFVGDRTASSYSHHRGNISSNAGGEDRQTGQAGQALCESGIGRNHDGGCAEGLERTQGRSDDSNGHTAAHAQACEHNPQSGSQGRDSYAEAQRSGREMADLRGIHETTLGGASSKLPGTSATSGLRSTGSSGQIGQGEGGDFFGSHGDGTQKGGGHRGRGSGHSNADRLGSCGDHGRKEEASGDGREGQCPSAIRQEIQGGGRQGDQLGHLGLPWIASSEYYHQNPFVRLSAWVCSIRHQGGELQHCGERDDSRAHVSLAGHGRQLQLPPGVPHGDPLLVPVLRGDPCSSPFPPLRTVNRRVNFSEAVTLRILDEDTEESYDFSIPHPQLQQWMMKPWQLEEDNTPSDQGILNYRIIDGNDPVDDRIDLNDPPDPPTVDGFVAQATGLPRVDLSEDVIAACAAQAQGQQQVRNILSYGLHLEHLGRRSWWSSATTQAELEFEIQEHWGDWCPFFDTEVILVSPQHLEGGELKILVVFQRQQHQPRGHVPCLLRCAGFDDDMVHEDFFAKYLPSALMRSTLLGYCPVPEGWRYQVAGSVVRFGAQALGDHAPIAVPPGAYITALFDAHWIPLDDATSLLHTSGFLFGPGLRPLEPTHLIEQGKWSMSCTR